MVTSSSIFLLRRAWPTGESMLILPLATRRDKVTQVRWGMHDFARRFGRPPEGLWLPECAADTETLEVLAECGIQFTVLSPYQAARVRPLASTSTPPVISWSASDMSKGSLAR